MINSVLRTRIGRAGLTLLLSLVFGIVLSGCTTTPAQPSAQLPPQTPVPGTEMSVAPTPNATPTALPHSLTVRPESTTPSSTNDASLDLSYPGAQVVPVGQDFFQSPEPDKTSPTPNGTVSLVLASTAPYTRLVTYYIHVLTTEHYTPTSESTINHSDPTFTIMTQTNGVCLVQISLWSPTRLHMSSQTLPPGYAPVVARLSPTQTLIVTSRVPQQAGAQC